MTSQPAPFQFRGRIPASKSILNRLLIMRSFEPGLVIEGDSDADDVVKMKSALLHFERGEMADCGSAGTTLRFVALRVSRKPGHHHLSGTLRLFERPHRELVHVLEQLGCEAELRMQRLTIRGHGWKIPDAGVEIDRSISSQFASALLLSAWELEKPLTIKFTGEEVSMSYFAMTVDLAKRCGMLFLSESPSELTIAPGCKVIPQSLVAEPDLSSAFAVGGLAAVAGVAEILDWPAKSLQPDAAFPAILARMGVTVVESGGALRVERPKDAFKPVECDLRDSPDLFPVLATLCALAQGRSRLFGAPHLAHKESSRIAKSAELIRLMGRKAREIEGGIEIEGQSANQGFPNASHAYDTDHDHRLAMAAAVARAAGVPLEIRHPEVVNKSFPSFWSIANQAVATPGADSEGARR